MADFIHQDDLSVPPLSDVERAWIKKLDLLFKKMPPRLKLLESGDSVKVIDGYASSGADLHDGKARDAGIVLADLDHATMRVTGASA